MRSAIHSLKSSRKANVLGSAIPVFIGISNQFASSPATKKVTVAIQVLLLAIKTSRLVSKARRRCAARARPAGGHPAPF
jgi:hypothetical protein